MMVGTMLASLKYVIHLTGPPPLIDSIYSTVTWARDGSPILLNLGAMRRRSRVKVKDASGPKEHIFKTQALLLCHLTKQKASAMRNRCEDRQVIDNYL